MKAPRAPVLLHRPSAPREPGLLVSQKCFRRLGLATGLWLAAGILRKLTQNSASFLIAFMEERIFRCPRSTVFSDLEITSSRISP